VETSLLEVDSTFALASGLGSGRGVPDDRLHELGPRLQGLAREARAETERGGLAFLALPEDVEGAEAIRRFEAALPPAGHVVVAGIGGSALAARVLRAAAPPGEGRRVHVLDTVDPERVSTLLDALEPEDTALLGISKSGRTLESTATFLVAEDWMRQALGREAVSRIAVVCGAASNPMRERATRFGYACFPIPQGVEGRYSALSAVGLLPAALAGVDPLRILEGGRAAAARSLADAAESNPALTLAALHYLAQGRGRSAAVLWAYGEALRPLGAWWVQLVAESLGKRRGQGRTGVSPLAASGPQDQHSLLQLLLEGPDDKFTVFVAARQPRHGIPDPAVPPGGRDLTPAGGARLGSILAAEREATEFALARAGRPCASVTVRDAGPESLGAFLVTWEAAVYYWGRLLGVDPFGQPAVAQGKEAALARLLGSPPELAQAMDAHRSVPRRIARL
jgi:glucose-6-phosphate isomerase